ncbi:MAG: rubredoxin [Desulfobacteraceae bacterium]|nr:rubredoxin [Desulfobacteraceae bacterium]
MNKETKLYACSFPYCGFIYNPEVGDPSQEISSGTTFEDLPQDWKCPKCKAAKSVFNYFKF